VPPLCERDPEKPKQCMCMKCTGLKEQCKWLEVGGLGPVVDKGKGKAVMMSPQGGEKRKKMNMTVKVIINNNEIVEVLGPSGQWSGFNPGPFLDWLDQLTRVVEQMTGQMCRVVDATHLVARGNEWLMACLETFLEECQFFTVPWDEDKDEEDSKVEVNPEEGQTVQGLQEEQENPGSGMLE